MKKYINKKILYLIIVFVILITYIKYANVIVYGSTVVFSGSTSSELQTVINSAGNGDIIVLTKDITANSTITINKTITLTDGGQPIVVKRDASFTGTVISVTGKNVTLNLKGTNIDYMKFNGNSVKLGGYSQFFIVSEAVLNMYSGVIVENCDTTNAYITSNSVIGIIFEGIFNMYGGVISNNKTSRAGAVDLDSSTLNMYGGVISNNSNLYYDKEEPGGLSGSGGGGVRLDRRSTFNMMGGKIINNTATTKGTHGYYGLWVSQISRFNMIGGLISDNYILINNIILSGDAFVDIGKTITLTPTISPSNVADKTLLWFSSDNNIATVDQSGNVTGISSGTVTITAAANDGSGVKATKIITVKSSITGIAITGDSRVSKGDIINLRATIIPGDASNKTLIWTSSNTNIATVNGVGLVGTVRGIEKGTVTITAAATDGSGVKATKTITVENIFVSTETNCILLGSKIDYQSVYSDSENDPVYKFSYLYNHNAVYYDNSMGTIEKNNIWINEPIRTFERTGKYIIYHKITDNPSTAMYNENFANYRKDSNTAEKILYVHRKPIAVFTLNGTSIIDNSYDLDHQSSPTKGIVKWEWNYIHPDGNIYTYSTTSKEAGENKVKEWLAYYGTNAKIYLRVQDIEGTWSDWSDDLPIADFVITYNPLILNRQVQKVIDQSFDSKGLPLTYSWTVIKDATTLFISSNKDISAEINTYINSNGTGNYIISLRVTNSSGQQSNIRTQNFNVISINNQGPTADFNLVSNENPVWTFPKILDLYTLPYRPLNTLFYEEYARIDTYAHDSNPDNLGFIYDWKFERYAVKNIENIYGAPQNTYTSNFVNSFKNQGMGWGAYRITMKVTDRPPIPPYQSTDTKSVTVTKYYYIVPEISIAGSCETAKTDIMVGDTVKLKAKTNKETENVNCTLAGTNYTLNKVSEDSSSIYWEKEIVIPDTITESGTYNLKYVAKTTYGGNGNITREVQDNVPINIVALKLINFRITNIVNHPHITFPYTKDMLISKLIPYKTGYYVTFRIDSKGKPDDVWGRVDVGNNGSIDQIISMSKVESGDTETWQGRFYTSAYLPAGTVISIKLDCNKGITTYDYNLKENWDGRSLITNGSALQDGRINLTN